MGIVNLTPDSFSNDGVGCDVERAVAHARVQFEAGADILDIGAESTRPGAIPTPEKEELRRLLPVLEKISAWGVPVSVDTYKPVVMRAAIDAGASMINDINGLRSLDAVAAVRNSDCGICLMHMQGTPGTMQVGPEYKSVVEEVRDFLSSQVELCKANGIQSERLVIDPGFGFGKNHEHNLALMRSLTAISPQGVPLLVGISRKSILGVITGRSVESRKAASISAALILAQKGAKILRVHDVAATRDALAVWAAIEQGEMCD